MNIYLIGSQPPSPQPACFVLHQRAAIMIMIIKIINNTNNLLDRKEKMAMHLERSWELVISRQKSKEALQCFLSLLSMPPKSLLAVR